MSRVALAGLAAAAVAVAAGAVRIASPVPAPRAVIEASTALTVPGGAPPAIAMPRGGSLLLTADALDGPEQLAAAGADVVRPIGSVAKTMTALVVLEAHPLAPAADGPTLTMTAADVALFHQAVAADGSALPVQDGEVLSERQLLLGLMLPSANNLAETLARWVAGTRDAFVDRLNATAQRLGMSSSHFDDPSGYSPRTVSTAADLVRLGRAALAVPALAQIVATSQAPFPDGSTLHNLDALLDTEPGWLGIKTGETAAAGGCLLFAARIGAAGPGPGITVVGAVLGQPHLADALAAARAAVESAADGYSAIRVAGLAPPLAGRVTAAWGDSAAISLGPGTGPTLELRRRAPLALTLVAHPLPERLATGDTVAWLEARSGRILVARWPVRVTAAPLGPAPLLYRLLRR